MISFWVLSFRKELGGTRCTSVLFSVLSQELRSLPSGRRLHSVLDNSPKNRTESVTMMLQKIQVSLCYITPSTPDRNLAENSFLFLKKSFSSAKNLTEINGSCHPSARMLACIINSLESLSVLPDDRPKIIYMKGLIKLVKTSKFNL